MCYSLKRGDLQRGVIHTTDYALEGGDGGGGELRSQSANKNHLSTRSAHLDPSPLYKWAFLAKKNQPSIVGQMRSIKSKKWCV